ncbi:uncharacterized protein LOC109504700 [Harpegnathos saltator]|uniref:uncharacterized protein LOC109504700 n=1 Tax=Harpegnathos saltator TaxID=610380 RepID=UPI000DBEE924|nr:uncharacterized protein LOC109504700 [Harpegnathos saltator]
MASCSGLNLGTLTKSNVTSFVQCVLELVADSLTTHATAIAVRIHTEKREIQVIDNGIGIRKDTLDRVGEYDAKGANNPQEPYNLSDSNSRMLVSFSIRDEEQKRVALRIAKSHSPIDILRALFGKDLPLNHIWSIQCCTKYDMNYHGYVGLSDKNAMQCIFLNYRLINCSFILKLIITDFTEKFNLSSCQKFNGQDLQDKNIFILFFLTLTQDEFEFITENGKKLLMFRDVRKILNNIKACSFKLVAKETTIPAGTTYSRDTQLLKQIHLRLETSIFNNTCGRSKNITPLTRGHKIIITGIKRKMTTSNIVTTYFNKRWNRSDDIKATDHQSNKLDIACAKYKKSRESQLTKKSHIDVDKNINSSHKTQTHCRNLAIESNSADKIGDDRNSKNDDFASDISLCSEWSDWSYCSNNKEANSVRNVQDTFSKTDERYQRLFEYTRQFNFLPQKLYRLLQYRQDKITNVKHINDPNSSDSVISLQGNWQREKIEVHPCNLKEKLCELRLSHASLKCIKVINQINDEFIAAWMMYDQMKILLMIDQHAVHERIRYEDLLLRYKAQKEDELLSVNLRQPLAVKFPTQTCNLLLRHKMLLRKYGISLGSLKKNTLLIRAIPQCLVTSNDRNSEKVLSRIYNLLNDILEDYNATSRTSILPLTIHNAIASEACHVYAPNKVTEVYKIS